MKNSKSKGKKEIEKLIENIEKLAPLMKEGEGLLVEKKGDRYMILYGSEEDFKNVTR